MDIKRLIKGFTDKTRTFPISGKFSEKSRALYYIVLRMQTEKMAKTEVTLTVLMTTRKAMASLKILRPVRSTKPSHSRPKA